MDKMQTPYRRHKILRLKIVILTALLTILGLTMIGLWVKFMVAVWTVI